MSDDRRLDVLRAIVEDYVATREPVGSRALVERHSLGVSPATIRNDMAALEEGGYIAQPHTSAGRVPTDKGYRLFVDQLSSVKPLSSPERRAIGTFLESAQDLDDVVDRAVRLIAQLTQQVAVVQYPSLRRSALRHVELVPVGMRHLLVVLITDTGRVEQRTLELDGELDDVVVARLRARLNVSAAGRRLVRAAHRARGPRGLVRADRPGPRAQRRRRARGDARRRRARSGSCSRAPPTSRGSAAPTCARSDRCWRRSRSRSSCSGCSPRWPRTRRRSPCGSAARPSTTASSRRAS